MDAELLELLRKLHAYHVTNLNLLSRLAARKAVLGTKEGDRITDFITRELEQVDVISKAMTVTPQLSNSHIPKTIDGLRDCFTCNSDMITEKRTRHAPDVTSGFCHRATDAMVGRIPCHLASPPPAAKSSRPRTRA